MEETRVETGSDWCTLKIARDCPGKDGHATECILLGEQVRACGSCLKELNKEEFPEDYEWTLDETWHEGLCEKVTATIENDEGGVTFEEEITFCPKCLRKVLLSHDPRTFDWVLLVHDKSHTKSKKGLDGRRKSRRACRECLLIALYRLDRLFFDLVITVDGKELVENLRKGNDLGRAS